MFRLLASPLPLLVAAGLLVLAAPGVAYAKKKGKDPAQEAFEAGYKSEEGAERGAAVLALADAPDPVKYDLLSKKVIPREKRADVLAKTVAVLERVKDPKVVDKIISASRKGKVGRRILYLEALAAMNDHAGAHEALIKATKDKDPYVRGMAAYGLGEHRKMDALEPLLAMLTDARWQVQAAALEALPRLENKAAVREKVPVLVDFLAKASGRMRQDYAYALKRITGKNLGRDVKKWRKYVAGEPLEPKPKSKPTGPYGNQAVKPYFYSLEVTSNRVVIIFDKSLSMYDGFDIDKRRLRRETKQRVVTGEEGAPEAEEDDGYKISWWRIKTRLDMAREQAKYLISQLRDPQEFEIIFYSTEVEPWMSKMVRATTNNKAKALLALDEVLPDDKTNTWGALAAAFDMMDNAKKSYLKGPDEVYLITDGQPSVGDIIEKDQIYDAVIQMYKVNRIRINCIAIGVRLRFLKKLCTRTGGQAKFF